MGKKRKLEAVDVLGSSTLTDNDDATKSVDLSSMTRAVAFVTETDSSATVYLRTEITPDGFDVADSAATWFRYWAADKAYYYGVAAGASDVMQLPAATDQWEDGNTNPPCGRRMRVAKQSGTGVAGTCMVTATRVIS